MTSFITRLLLFPNMMRKHLSRPPQCGSPCCVVCHRSEFGGFPSGRVELYVQLKHKENKYSFILRKSKLPISIIYQIAPNSKLFFIESFQELGTRKFFFDTFIVNLRQPKMAVFTQFFFHYILLYLNECMQQLFVLFKQNNHCFTIPLL